ncbi:DUF1127 domain-containing protein [Ensifer canadensis]
MSNLLTGMSEFYNAVWVDIRQPAKYLTEAIGRYDPFRLLVIWDERLRFRQQLEMMARHTPELLDDVGLTKAQVERETRKPFWQR